MELYLRESEFEGLKPTHGGRTKTGSRGGKKISRFIPYDLPANLTLRLPSSLLLTLCVAGCFRSFLLFRSPRETHWFFRRNLHHFHHQAISYLSVRYFRSLVHVPGTVFLQLFGKPNLFMLKKHLKLYLIACTCI